MSLQIESKWLGEESVDGSKIKIKVGQALVAEGSLGDIDLIKVGMDDKAEGPQGVLASEDFVNSEISNEASLRSQADIDLAGQIAAEASVRESTDTGLLNLISTETSDRISADSALNVLISNEESARTAEDLTFLKLNGTRGMASNLNMASGGSAPQLSSITSHTTTAVDEAVTISGNMQFVPGQNGYELYKDGVLVTGSYADGTVYYMPNYESVATGFGFGFFNSNISFTAHQIGQYSLYLYVAGSLTPYKIINLANGTDAGDAVNKGQLDSAVSSILSNVDPAMIDSFTEVVTAFQTADSDLSNAIQALGTGSSSALGQEILDRENADNLLSGRLVVLEADPTTKTYVDGQISFLDGEISSEETARIAADEALDARLDVLEADPTTKTYVDAEVLTEKSRAEGAEGALDMRLLFIEQQYLDLDLKFEVGVDGVETSHIVLPVLAKKLYKVCVGRLNVFNIVDYTISTEMVVSPGLPGMPGFPLPVTKITWIGDLASGGNSPIANGDKIFVTYLS